MTNKSGIIETWLSHTLWVYIKYGSSMA